MITYKGIVISNNRHKDGSYNIKIRVTFKGVSRRLPTTLYCTQSELTRSLKIKSGDLQSKIDELIARMRAAASDISPFDLEGADVDWVVSHIKSNMMGDSFRLDFFDWADKYLTCKMERTRKNYDAAVNAFERFVGKRELDINAITRTMLLDFMDFNGNEKRMVWSKNRQRLIETDKERGTGASSRHLAKLQNIYNAAKERYNDEDIGRIVIPKNPFDKIKKVYPPCKGQRSLGVETMQPVILLRLWPGTRQVLTSH